MGVRAVGRKGAPNAARKAWAARVSSSVLVQRGGRAAFERGKARGAERFGRHEPDNALAAATGFLDALALDILKKGSLFRSVDVPKAEIIFIDGGHVKRFPCIAG